MGLIGTIGVVAAGIGVSSPRVPSRSALLAPVEGLRVVFEGGAEPPLPPPPPPPSKPSNRSILLLTGGALAAGVVTTGLVEEAGAAGEGVMPISKLALDEPPKANRIGAV